MEQLGTTLIVLIATAIVALIVRRRWRRAQARAAEVRRLAFLAAAEAERAEVEAAREYQAALSREARSEFRTDHDQFTHNQNVCSVCFRETIKVCSRCKAVKYCSGTCQIYHWRQGHKDTCFPPNLKTEQISTPPIIEKITRTPPPEPIIETVSKTAPPEPVIKKITKTAPPEPVIEKITKMPPPEPDTINKPTAFNPSTEAPKRESKRGAASKKMGFPYEIFVKLYNSDKTDIHPFGLVNVGNSCYANAVFQILAFTRPLSAYLLEGNHSKYCSQSEWCFLCEFERLIIMGKEGRQILSPKNILDKLFDNGSSFRPGREEDAHEFLKFVIEKMQSVCLNETGLNAANRLIEETTLVQLIFGGYLRSKITCQRCQGSSVQVERMLDLTVEIQGDIATLKDALAKFTSSEDLDGDNKYQCDRCVSYERAKKKITILEAPNVLIIALKRYQAGKYGKITKPVEYPEQLSLAQYMSRTDDISPVYALYAVVVHEDVMNASFSGHYISYVKDAHNNWFEINDSKVKQVPHGKVLSRCAYLLLYARCSPRAPSSVRRYMKMDPVRYRPGPSDPSRHRPGPQDPSHHRSGPQDPSHNRPNPPDVPHQRRPGAPEAAHHRPCAPEPVHHRPGPPDTATRTRTEFPDESSSDTSSLLSNSEEGSSISSTGTNSSTSTEGTVEYEMGLGFDFDRIRYAGLRPG